MILRTRKKKWSRYLKPKTFMSRLVLGCPMLNDMENWWKEQYVHITWSEWVSESHSVVSDSLRPHGLYSPWNSPGQNIGVGSLSLLQQIFPTQGSNPGLLHCRGILLPAKPQGSPRITGVGSLSLLQGIFQTQELNWGLLHSRWIHYQLSYEGSPELFIIMAKPLSIQIGNYYGYLQRINMLSSL